MTGIRRIDQLQNSEHCLALLRAVAVTHRHAQRAQSVSLAVSLVVAGLGLAATLVPAMTPTTVFVGALWAVTYAIFVVPWSGRHLQTSATLQEMFDVVLFNLPWNAVVAGDRVPEDELSRLSRRFRHDESRLRDYYLVAAVPPPYDMLFCLEQNLAWGSRVRRRFAAALVAVVTLWCAAGVVVGIVTNSTISELASGWFVPSFGLLLLCLDTYRAQISITSERTRVLGLLRAASEDATSPALATEPALTLFTRQIQDVLFQLRRQQPRVPNWFFQRFHDSDMTDFRLKMRVLEERFGNPAGAAS
ncbi:S-4TM family putative pore-forming effector [Frankia sp. QA3]|uniref:S-4TM family putative pore-forming effector n=1 Tax=Frankia sp. QA3 TaxID=710111 RepID=UPI000269BEC6|nr:S-4TM family putative pore-forming effector [Frankia sp. QA3]EIV91907.1 hypothetical protein FraQA3DRAFT_1392 [Frankia sp. QA3]